MKRRLQWNTGREYDEHGQRMVIEQDPITGVVTFHDLSRQLWGEVVGLPTGLEEAELYRTVMEAYDYNRYFPCDYPGHLVWETENEMV